MSHLTDNVVVNKITYRSLLKISQKLDFIRKELFHCLENGSLYHTDCRVEEVNNLISGCSAIIPIYNFCDMLDDARLYKLQFMLNSFLGCNVQSCYIQRIGPDTIFKAHTTKDSIMLYRGYLPLIISYPANLSGVWIKNKGLCHFNEGQWQIHKLSSEYAMFNHTKSYIIILVVEFYSNHLISFPRRKIKSETLHRYVICKKMANTFQ